MTIDFYYNPLSASCRSVLLLAKELEICMNLKILKTTGSNGEDEICSLSNSKWSKIKQIKYLPVIEDEGGVWLSGNHSIILYLYQKYSSKNGKKKSLYPTQEDYLGQYYINQKLFFDKELQQNMIEAYQNGILVNKRYDEVKMSKLDNNLTYLNEELENSEWISGNSISLADFCIISTLSTIESCGHDLSIYKNLKAYIVKCRLVMKDFHEVNQRPCDSFRQAVIAKLKLYLKR